MQNLNVKNSNLSAQLKGKSPIGTSSVKHLNSNVSRKSLERNQIAEEDEDCISRGDRNSVMGGVASSSAAGNYSVHQTPATEKSQYGDPNNQYYMDMINLRKKLKKEEDNRKMFTE